MFGGVWQLRNFLFFFLGGAQQLLVPGIFLMIQEKEVKGIYGDNSGVPVSFFFWCVMSM